MAGTNDPWDALEQGILVENPLAAEDYRTVVSFLSLSSREHRPIDKEVHPRDQDDHLARRALLPDDFFEPFNQVLELVDVEPIRVSPEAPRFGRWNDMASWNNSWFVSEVVTRITKALEKGSAPKLVPALVAAHLNLAREERPQSEEGYRLITAIVVPGGRTFDRVIEAYRLYLACEGKPALITTGNAPYWDPNNSGIGITEAQANRAHWRLLGIPDEKIYTEPESKDTPENAHSLLEELKEIGGRNGKSQHVIALVTSPFHLARFRLNFETTLREYDISAHLYAFASQCNRYYAPEFFFYTDPKAGYDRDITLKNVLDEYLKIAFDLCAEKRSSEQKAKAYEEQGSETIDRV